MKPPISILSKEFVYTPSWLTDVAKTFAKVRAEGRCSPPPQAPTVEETRQAYMNASQRRGPQWGAYEPTLVELGVALGLMGSK